MAENLTHGPHACAIPHVPRVGALENSGRPPVATIEVVFAAKIKLLWGFMRSFIAGSRVFKGNPV